MGIIWAAVVFYKCVSTASSNAAVLVEGKDSPIIHWDSYSGSDPVPTWVSLRPNFTQPLIEGNTALFGNATWEDAPFLMYEGTKISGNWERIPKKLRGVYWMNGNGMPEVLASMQYAEFYEKEKIILVPT